MALLQPKDRSSVTARRGSFKDQQRWLAYCDAELARADLPPARRQVLEAKREHLAKQLVDRCSVCGRQLSDPVSLERLIGPECYEAARS